MGETPAEGPATMTATAPEGRRRRRRTIIIVAVAVLVVAIVVAAVALALRPRRSAPTATSTTYTVQRSSLTRTVSASGTFEPVQQLSVNFPASGTITDVKVAVGDKVTKGQILATEDSTALGASLQSAQAAVDSAQAQVNALTSTATTAQRTAAQATLASDRAKLSQAQANYDGSTLTSPIAGTIAKVSISKGGVATGTGSSGSGAGGSSGSGAGSALAAAASTSGSGTTGDVVVVDTSAWQVNASVGAADLPSLKAGQAVTMTAPDGRTTVSGSVHSVSQVASTSSSTGGTTTASFPVVVDVTDTKGAQLFIGSTTTASVAVEQLDNVIAIPSAAIIQSGGHPAVRLAANGSTTDRAVTLGSVIGQRTVVTDGLAPGDTIQVPTFGAVRGSASASPGPSGQRTGGGGTGGLFGRGGR